MRNSEESRADSNYGERKFRKNLQSFDAAPKRSVVMRDLPFCCTSKDLQNFIAQHLGVPPSIAVVLRNPDGKTLQYGCALFESEELATTAIENVHLKRLHGRDIRVLPYSSASLREVSRSGDVLISFIGLSAMVEPVTEQNIRSIVEEYGDIDYISIRQHKFSKEGIQNGFGFVTMASQEENQRVLDNVKGLEVENVLYTSEESNHVKKGVQKVVDDMHSEPNVVNSGESSISKHGFEANSAPVDISPSNSNFSKSPVITNESKRSSDMSGQQSSTNQSLNSNSQSSRSNNNNTTNYRPNVKNNARDDGKPSSTLSSNQTNQTSYHPPQMNAQYVQQQHIPSTESTVVNSFASQLMSYHQPRPYSPSTLMPSGPTNSYVPAMGNNSSSNVSTLTNTPPPPSPLVTSPQLQAYPVASIPQSQQYLPSAFSSVPIYPSGNQMTQNNIHFPTIHHVHSIRQLHHPQFSGNINMTPVQPLPTQNSSTSSTIPSYQYPIVVDHSGTPTNPSYVVNPYMPLSGNTTQQPHLPQQPPSAHYQQGQMPASYVHISVAPTGVNVPVASMVMPPGQGPSSFPLSSSTSSNSSNPSYHHIQYSTPTYAHQMGGPSPMHHHHHHHRPQHNLSNHHHQQQQPPQQQQHSRQMPTAIYQQQPHQSTAFVSSTPSTSRPHSHNNQSPSTNQQHSFATPHTQHPSYHSSQHDQQRR